MTERAKHPRRLALIGRALRVTGLRLGTPGLPLAIVGLLAGAAFPVSAQPSPRAPAPASSAPAPVRSGPASGLSALAGPGNNSQPLDITAEDGIEWQQDNKVYIARGNAVAKRGNVTLKADVLSAYYRPVQPAPGTAPPAPSKATPPSTAAGSKTPGAKSAGSSPEDQGNTEIWRVVAEGHVVIFTPTQTVTGEKAIYDIDQAVVVLTGNNLKLTTPQDTVTARDTLEWYDTKKLAVARGDGIATRGDRKVHGDVLVATIVEGPNQQSHITRVDATGHVVISTPDEVATGERGVYNLETSIATLIGNVVITRGDNVLRGQFAVLDTARNISRLLPAAPSDLGTPPVVEGLLVKNQPTRPGATPAAGAASAPGQNPKS